jgi:hypothetical protein
VAGLTSIDGKLDLVDRFGALEDELEPRTCPAGSREGIEAAGEVATDIARGA